MAPTGTLANDADTVAVGLSSDKALFISGPANAVIKFQASPDGGTTWGDVLGIPMDGLRAPESSRTLPAGGTAVYQFRLPYQLVNKIQAKAVGAQGGTTNIWWADVLSNASQPAITPPATTTLTQNVLTASVRNTALTTVGNGTLTAAAITGGLVTRTGPVAAFTDTTDTAANLIAALPALGQGQGVEFVLKNSTAFTLTLAAGSGVTLAGSTVLPANTAGRFLVSITGAATVTVTGEGVLFAAGGVPEASAAITTAGAGTLTAAAVVGGLITRTGPSGAFTDTTDTAAAVIAAMPNAAVGESWELTYINATAFVATLAGGVGVTVSELAGGTLTVSPNSWARFLVTYSAAGAVTVQGLAQGPNARLQPAKFSTVNVTTGTLAAGNASGAAFTSLTSTNAVPGAQAMRTPAQILTDTPGLFVGMSYVLRITNTGAGTLTLATDSGAGFTMTGTMTVPTNTFRDFIVTLNTATTGTVQAVGVGTMS